MNFSDFHFLRPLWLLLIPLIIWLGWRLYRQADKRTLWQGQVDQFLLQQQLISPETQRQLWPYLVTILCGILLNIALAGPVWEKRPTPVFKGISARVIVLDLSRSMDSPDVKPSRLVRSRHKVLDLLDGAGDTQTALIVFTQVPYVISPLTNDSATIKSMVSSFDTALPPIQGSDIGLALKKAGELMAQSGVKKSSIVLITDSIPSEDDYAVAADLQRNNHLVSVLAVGTSSGLPIPLASGGLLKDPAGNVVVPGTDLDALKRLAVAGGGLFTSLRSSNVDVEQLLAASPDVQLNDTQSNEQLSDQWRENGFWLLIGVLPFVLLAFRRGVVS